MLPSQHADQLPVEGEIIHEYNGRVLVEIPEASLDHGLRRYASRLEDTGYLSYRTWTGEVSGHRPDRLPDLQNSYFLLALVGPMDRQWQAAIQASGLTIVDHVNPYGVLVRGDARSVEQAAGQIFTSRGHAVITHALELPEESRLSPVVNEWVTGLRGVSELGARTVGDEALVRLTFHADADFDQVHAQITEHLQPGPEFVAAPGSAQYQATADSLAAALDQVPEIGFVHGVHERELHNNIGAQAHLTNIEPVWNDLGYAGSGIIAGVNDSGMDLAHDDFPSGSVVATTGAMDNTDTGHGTHVTGTVAGRGAADSPENTHECGDVTPPLSDARGMAWEAQIAHNNLFDGGVTDETAMMQWQAQQGAVINNNSWGYTSFGTPATGYDAETAAVDVAVRDADTGTNINEQMSIVFSAGNFAESGISKPGNAKNVITVGATQNDRCGSYIPSQCAGPDIGDMACFSSHGPSQGRVKPDIVAPGTDVLSTQSGDPNASWGGWEQPFWTGDDYEIVPGTSMSAPMVTGAAAVFYEFYLDQYGQLPSPALVKAALINSATDLGMDFPSNIQGWGRLDLRRSLEGPVEDGILFFEQDQVDHLETGESWTTDVGVAGDEDPLKISLVWTDPAGAAGCNPCHINDLDLIVTAPDGTVYRGNQFVGAWSEPDATDRDELNNVQNVFIEAPMSGDWQVEVNAFNVAENPSNLDGQDFALVATGDFGGISIEPPSAAVCAADDSFDYTVTLSGQFEGTTNLSSDNLPPGTSGVFDPNPVEFPDEESIFTVSGLGAVAGGEYEIDIMAVDDDDPDNFADGTAHLELFEDNPGIVDLLAPADGSIDVDLQPEFSWDVAVEAAEYQFQLATSDDFTDPLIDEVLEETSLTPEDELATGTNYFWRVRANNACGNGDWSGTFEFQTRFEPIADVSPESFAFELTLGESDSDTLSISNVGTGNLVWDIDTDTIDSDGISARFDGDFDIDNWELVNNPAGVNGSFFTEDGPPVELFVVGGDDGTGGDTDFQIEIPSDGVIHFDWGYQSEDTACWDSGGYAINGEFTELACNDQEVPYFDESETVEVSQGDLFAFRVHTQDGAFGAGTFGVTNFEFVPAVCDSFQDVPWLSANPDNGSTPAGDTDNVTVTVDSSSLNADDFEAYLCVSTNDQDAPMIPVQVELTVFDEDAGALAGNVMSEGYCSEDPFPAGGALIEVEGTSGNVFTTNADGNGDYSININENESPVDVTFSADGHLPMTVEGLNVTAGETTEQNADLLLDAPCATVAPDAFSENITAGDVENYDLEIGNTNGAGSLDWDIEIAESDCADAQGVGWLSAAEDTGTVAANDTDIVILTADSDGLADGVYEALVCVATSDSEADSFEVPFELTVVDPSLAVFDGQVTSQGVCADEPGPIEGAQVVITGADNTFETETDSSGEYSMQISEDESPVDIMVSAENHVDGTLSGVTFEGGDSITANFELAADSACAEVSPEEINETAGLGETVETTIEIESTGNQTLTWLISYLDGGGPSGTVASQIDHSAAEEAVEAGLNEVPAPTAEEEEMGIEPHSGEYSHTRGDSLYQGMVRDSLIAEGVLLMPDSSNDRIVALDPETGDVIDLNFIPEILDQGVPVQVILHPDGQRLLLTRQSGSAGGVIESYDLEGEFLGIFAPEGGQDTSIMQNIRGLAVHPTTQNILVTVSGTTATDPENQDSVLEFGQEGEFLGRFIESGEGGLDGPWSIIFRDSDVIVSDSGSDALRVFDMDGEFIELFTDDPNFPQQIYENADGHVLAAGFSNPAGAWEWDAGGDQIGLYGPESGLRGIYDLPGGTIVVTNSSGVHEIDRDGNLVRTITSDVNGRHVSFVQSGIVCDAEAPEWLSVDPDSGSTDPGNTDILDVILDTDGLVPGEYNAQICVESNDPISPVIPVDVTFTVELGDNFGTVDGEVFSQGFCGQDPFPAAGADIELVGQVDTYTTTADENGFYEINVPIADSPYDVTASAPDHFPETQEDVVVTAGETTTVDFNLQADVPCIEVDPTEIAATLATGESEDHDFDVFNVGTQTLDWVIDTNSRAARDESEPLIGFNFTTSGSGTADPQNWTRISDSDGTIVDVPDDTGEPTDVSFSWGPVTGDGPLFLSTDTLAPDAVPQHDYDLSGMTGYGFRSGGEFFIEVSGLDANADYEYWMVAYRGSTNIDNIVRVSDGDEINAFEFNQFLDGGDNEGHFVINDLQSSDQQVWDELSFITQSDSDGNIRIEWEGDTQTTVIGAFAIRSALTCDIPDWLSVAPDSGSIDDGGPADTVTATLDATGLEPGDYTAAICVESNDPTTPVVPVVVDLQVEFGDDVGTLDGTVFSQGYCGDNPFAAEGATIEAVGQTETFTTTADENGHYEFFIPEDEGPVDVTASAPDHLPETVADVTIIGGDTVTVDFDLLLDAPCATVDPESFSQTLPAGGSAIQDLEIGNFDGAAELDWSVFTAEAESVDPRAHFPATPYETGSGDSVSALAETGGSPGEPSGDPLPLGADVPAYSTTGWDAPGYITMDALGDGSYTVIEENQPTSVFAATFIDNDFDVHYGLATDGGDLPQDMLIEIDTATGEYEELGVVSGGAGETWTSMKWDHSTGTLYASSVSELYIIDPVELEATLVGDFDGAGTMIAIAISPEGLMYGIDLTNDVLVAIDKTNGDTSAIGPLGVAPNFAQDMDFDQTDGTLYWAGYFGGGDSQMMTIDLDTGEATSLSNIDGGSEMLSFTVALPGSGACMEAETIPWLSLSPDSGTTAAGSSDIVEVMMDAGDLSAGTYHADICVETSDASNSQFVVPVELIVEEAATGTLEGTLMSQGYCGADPVPAAGASVLIQGQTQTYAAVADGDGFYQTEIPAEESPVTVTAVADDHLTDTVADVEISAGETTTVDFDLVLDAPCATVEPEQMSFALPAGASSSQTLTIGNLDGGATLTWWLDSGTGCWDPNVETWLTLTGDLDLSGAGENTVPAGTAQNISATADAGGLEPGLYETTICIETDDDQMASFEVPVDMQVLPDEVFRDRFESEG